MAAGRLAEVAIAAGQTEATAADLCAAREADGGLALTAGCLVALAADPKAVAHAELAEAPADL